MSVSPSVELPELPELPGLDCGMCGVPTCDLFLSRLAADPTQLKRCIHLGQPSQTTRRRLPMAQSGATVAVSAEHAGAVEAPWLDTLGREYDFVLQHFPEEPGPREIILPHNPLLTREMNVQPGEILIGRPLGMSCGCPITHCGVVTQVDPRTGVIVWCVTGPLRPRAEGFKDIGYYIAEAYEGLIKRSRCDIRIGMRYYFQPEMCMLQWRHSGLVNFVNRTPAGLQVRVEGLWIG
jgi:uncharacterized Fe-S cluster-containing protein